MGRLFEAIGRADGAIGDDPKHKAYMLKRTQACNSMTHAERK